MEGRISNCAEHGAIEGRGDDGLTLKTSSMQGDLFYTKETEHVKLRLHAAVIDYFTRASPLPGATLGM